MISFLLGNWRAILIAVVVAGSFLAGVQVTTWKHKADTAAAIDKMEDKHIADMQEAAEIIGEEAERQQIVRIKYRTIYKQASNITNSNCLNADAIELWRKSNRSATEPEANKSDD